MGFRSRYSWTMAAIAIAALLLTALISENGGADDPPVNAPPAPANPVQHAANRNSPPPLPPLHSPYAQASNLAIRQPQPAARAIAPRPTSLSNVGLPQGQWSRDTALGKVKLAISGNKIAVDVEGSGEFAAFNPSLRGEYAVASDGTVFGLIHSIDMGVSALASQEMGEELMMFNSLSDIPFSMRTYAQPDLLAVKQVTFGLPMQLVMATDGDTGELSIYVQSMLTGQYENQR